MGQKTMYELTRDELNKYGAFNNKLPKIVTKIMDTIYFQNVPQRMKATIAVSELITYASQFRRNVELNDGTSVPINSVAFVITGSGNNKDSSVRAARKCFKPGYTSLLSKRAEDNRRQAIRQAQNDGVEPAEELESYKNYLKPEPPIFTSVASGPAFIQHINDLGEHEIGAGLVYSGEFADELAYNLDMAECIKVLSETYDLGEKEVKYTKAVEFRSKEISGHPVSGLMIGSPAYILYDESVKKKFEIAFMSKLARRAWLCYTPEQLAEPGYDSTAEMIEAEDAMEASVLRTREEVANIIKNITTHNIELAGKPIVLSKETSDLFKIYKRYNSEMANRMPNQNSTSVLVRKHLQWKCLKLAGAFAIIDKSEQIEAKHYIAAIQFAEVIAEDMGAFEKELNKSDYERFADYMKTEVDSSGHATISAHELKKKGFIKTISKNVIHQLITAAASYDREGVYSKNPEATEIQYDLIIKSESISISVKPIDNSSLNGAIERKVDKNTIASIKNKIASTANYGLSIEHASFKELDKVLKGDFVYSPFKFKGGIRETKNIVGGTKWLVLDIDDSNIKADEAHFMLQDINHHIALTSDPNNEFKFRVFIELDSVVELNSTMWRYFYLAIADYLALKVDTLPQSQLFFSYSGRKIYSTVDEEPLAVRDFLMIAHEKAEERPSVSRVFTTAQKKAMIEDELVTFDRAFDAEMGEGSRSMIWAARKAFFDLGMSIEDTINLIYRINDYWSSSMPEDRLERTIIEQIKRF